VKQPFKPSVIVVLIAVYIAAVFIGARLLLSQVGAPGSLVDQLSSVAAVGSHLLIFTATVGIVTMAVLEALKRLIPVRGYFHRWQIEYSLGNKGLAAITSLLSPPPSALGFTDPQSSISVIGGPPNLISGSRASAPALSWFDVPVEQLTAQIGTLAQQELDLSSTGRSSEAGGPILKGPSLIDALVGVPVMKGLTTDGPETNVASLRPQIEIRLDALQVDIGSRWRRVVRLAACIVATGITISVLLFSSVSIAIAIAVVVTTFFVGGFFAWLARDVVAGIERWRR
jgi:hypothetical protein